MVLFLSLRGWYRAVLTRFGARNHDATSLNVWGIREQEATEKEIV